MIGNKNIRLFVYMQIISHDTSSSSSDNHKKNKYDLTLSKKGGRNTFSFRSPWVTLSLNLFFPTHFVFLDHHFAMSTFIFEPTNVISRY
jgi:hypothetical protein